MQKVTKGSESALEIAIKQGSYECVHLILEAGVQIEPHHIKIAKEVRSPKKFVERERRHVVRDSKFVREAAKTE